MNLIAIFSCPSSFFSTSYLRANIPSVVPLPFLISSCSSTIPLTLLLLFCHPRFFPETSTHALATQCFYFSWAIHISVSFLYSDYQPQYAFLCELPLSLAGVQQLFLSIIFQLAQPPPASLLALHQCLFIFPTRPTR